MKKFIPMMLNLADCDYFLMTTDYKCSLIVSNKYAHGLKWLCWLCIVFFFRSTGLHLTSFWKTNQVSVTISFHFPSFHFLKIYLLMKAIEVIWTATVEWVHDVCKFVIKVILCYLSRTIMWFSCCIYRLPQNSFSTLSVYNINLSNPK